jgi:SAM-dependent methyltransferase
VSTPDHVRHNQAFWESDAAAYQAVHGAALGRDALAWGVWRIPESGVDALGDVRGRDVLELGCGAAQWAVALRAAGARVIGLDISLGQLGFARQADGALPLVAADAESAPFRDGAFDLVFCDHGAMSFCDPAATLPETARLLRPGGRLVFAMTAPLVYLTYDQETERQTRKLRVDYFGMYRFTESNGTSDFQLPYGEWIRRFGANGFVVRDLIELQAPPDAVTTYEWVPTRWAQRWPSEHIWVVEKSEA